MSPNRQEITPTGTVFHLILAIAAEVIMYKKMAPVDCVPVTRTLRPQGTTTSLLSEKEVA